MFVRKVRRVRLNFVFVIHRLMTAGNVGKKGKVSISWLLSPMKVLVFKKIVWI